MSGRVSGGGMGAEGWGGGGGATAPEELMPDGGVIEEIKLENESEK